MDKFSELKSAAMAATPGPWVVTEKNNVEAPNQKRFRPVAYIFGNRAEHKRAADAAFIAAANPAAVLALLAELEAKDKRIAELSRLLAHNIERAEAAEAKLATPVRLPRPACVYADHSYPAYSRKQVEEIITSAGMRFTVEGDE